MGKEEIFSKLNIKDYNSELEKIIEKKAFSEDTKNLLLNMLYKVETAYADYNKVKVETKQKKDILVELLSIIERDCKEIELVKPRIEEDEILRNRKSIGIRKERKIRTYPNEKAIIHAIYTLKRRAFDIDTNYTITKNALGVLLNVGRDIDSSEIIRDFDGWSWNINRGDIENLNINLIYQMIQYLLGNSFIEKWTNEGNHDDYIKTLEDELVRKYKKELGQELYKLICQTSILVYIENKEDDKNKVVEETKKLTTELERMDNKKKYLQELANKKKEIGKQIREIDKRINNSELLKEEYIKNNEEVPEEKKIFSLSDFSDYEQLERNKLMEELKFYSKLMEPMIYVETKNNIKERIKILGELNLDKEDELNNKIILLQKAFLQAFEETIKKTETKKGIEELIYKLRYYKFIPVGEKEYIKDIEELKKDIGKLEKLLITKACKLKALNILSNSIEINSNLVSNLLDSKIIDLNEVIFEFKKKNDKTLVNVYEENIIEFTKEYDYIEDLNVKYNKKIKLFI